MTENKKTDDMEQLLNEASLHTDENLHVDEPSTEFFEQMVQQQTEARYRRLWIELACLWIIALLCLSVLAITVVYAPLLFVVIQILSIVILGGYFVKESSRMVAWKQ
ncbi:YxlC family protein [Halobacillus mangrovi]|uniref:YxlC family protein n=1 Tax=Halobacillus mangrovi TaxID=402384 RepID=UPI003D96F5E8